MILCPRRFCVLRSMCADTDAPSEKPAWPPCSSFSCSASRFFPFLENSSRPYPRGSRKSPRSYSAKTLDRSAMAADHHRVETEQRLPPPLRAHRQRAIYAVRARSAPSVARSLRQRTAASVATPPPSAPSHLSGCKNHTRANRPVSALPSHSQQTPRVPASHHLFC